MRRIAPLGLSALGCLALLGPSSRATGFDPPIGARVAGADIVLVGKVVRVEKIVTAAYPHPTEKKDWQFQLVVLKTTEGLVGVKKDAEVRLGVVMGISPGVRGKPARSTPMIALRAGQQVLLFARKHPSADFHFVLVRSSILDKKDANFQKDLTEAKKYAALLADAEKSLTAKDANDRLLAAALLVLRHTNPPLAAFKWEPIDAKESKLILEALAEADWNAKDISAATGENVQGLFYRLRVIPRTGWKPPKDFA